MEIITCHLNADFDSLASMAAAKRLYPQALLVFPGSQERRVREFLESYALPDAKKLREIEKHSGEIKRLIIVDAKSPGRLGILSNLLSAPAMEVHVYDHHPHGPQDIHGQLEIIEPVGACATIFAEKLRAKELKPDPALATLMCLGIYEETGNLLFPSTTERDALAVAWLLKCGASLKAASLYLKNELGRQELALMSELLNNAEDLVISGFRVKIAMAEASGYAGDAALLAHTIMDSEKIDALLMMLSMDGKSLIVGRSRVPEIDIARVLEKFGGGGHWAAASATFQEVPLEELAGQIKETIRLAAKSVTTASEVMTRPVISAGADASISEAGKMMTRYGVNVLPVVKNGAYAGLISREAVERAIFHGFAKSKVTEFASTDAVTATPETPITEVESMMMERNQRFMPVLDKKGGISGAITRTDIMRVLYEDYLKRSQIPPEEMPIPAESAERLRHERNLARSIESHFPENVKQFLRLAGAAGDEAGVGVYMVGGSVRDLLRGRENLDIDIVVEGDAIGFARGLAARLGGKLKTHERFGTARILLDRLSVDLATARTEYYEMPAALPTVEVSSIKKDLQRRDFTINTLAVKLNHPEFGALIDFFGGRRDLREKTIRVLHDLSFVEDPTRAFRAVRFAVRFGFKLSRHTEALLKSAVRLGLFDRLSGTRMYEELCLMLEETDPYESVSRLGGYGLLGVIHPAIEPSKALDAVAAVKESLLWFGLSNIEGEKPDRKLLFLMAILCGLPPADITQALARLAVSPRIKDEILKDITGAEAALARMAGKEFQDPAGLYDALHGLSLEGLLLTLAVAPDERRKKDVTRFILELSREKPVMNGHDLQAMGIAPGPVYSAILSALLKERLRGRIKTRKDEELFVMKNFPV